MLKKFVTAFFILLAFSTVAQEITATQKIPSIAMPGSDFIVETTINKGSATGFMKFFQEIPEGLTATDIESKGGSFTFADNGAKVVWIAPPSDPTFTISYKVSIPAGVSGTKSFSGKISYISNNERKTVELEPKTVTIGNASPAIAKKETPAITPTTPISKPATTTPVQPATKTPVTTPAEVKKETPAIQPTPTFTKVPTSALPASPGKIYKVQIGAYSLKPKLDGIPDITTLVLENGITKYFSGNFATYEEAVKRKKEMADKGFQGAFIVSFENGKIVK